MAATQAAEAIAYCAQYGFSQYLGTARVISGWMLTAQGQAEVGLALMQQGLMTQQAAGTQVSRPYCLALLAEAYAWHGFDGRQYVPQTSTQLAGIGLGVTLWEGTYEAKHDTWLRWTDATGTLMLTGKERAEQERQRAAHERLAREDTVQRLAQAEQRLAQLAAMLRQLGHEPPA